MVEVKNSSRHLLMKFSLLSLIRSYSLHFYGLFFDIFSKELARGNGLEKLVVRRYSPQSSMFNYFLFRLRY